MSISLAPTAETRAQQSPKMLSSDIYGQPSRGGDTTNGGQTIREREVNGEAESNE